MSNNNVVYDEPELKYVVGGINREEVTSVVNVLECGGLLAINAPGWDPKKMRRDNYKVIVVLTETVLDGTRDHQEDVSSLWLRRFDTDVMFLPYSMLIEHPEETLNHIKSEGWEIDVNAALHSDIAIASIAGSQDEVASDEETEMAYVVSPQLMGITNE